MSALAALSEDERAIYATRIIEGQWDNGGLFQVFGNGVDHLLEPAIGAYEHLGLLDYAALIRAVRAAGFRVDSPLELGEQLDGRYFGLSGSESARAELIKGKGPSA
jgi:hypothetical protein